MFKITMIRKDKLRSIEDRLDNLKKKVKQLECPHTYTELIKEYNRCVSGYYVYYSKCDSCEKEVGISKEEYLEEKLKKEQNNVKNTRKELNKLNKEKK